EDRREHDLSGVDALHRPARLFLFAHEQLGLRPERREANRTPAARARRIHSRHHCRTHALGESHLSHWLPAPGHGRARYAAHVCLPRTRVDPRSLRAAERFEEIEDPLMYAFREREWILDLFESLSGSRMMCNYMRFGGCRVDLPAGWLEQARKVVDSYPAFLDEFETLLTENEILVARTQGVGILPADL